MQKHCAKSCGYCGTEGICADDVDLKGRCPQLKEAQGCETEWMKMRCTKTCDVCWMLDHWLYCLFIYFYIDRYRFLYRYFYIRSDGNGGTEATSSLPYSDYSAQFNIVSKPLNEKAFNQIFVVFLMCKTPDISFCLHYIIPCLIKSNIETSVQKVIRRPFRRQCTGQKRYQLIYWCWIWQMIWWNRIQSAGHRLLFSFLSIQLSQDPVQAFLQMFCE